MKPLTEELLSWKEDEQRDVVQEAVQGEEAQVIFADDAKAGWLQVHEDEVHIDLGQIYVKPELQGQGIATSLIQKLIEQAEANDKALTLSVMKNNPAKALYERLGFQVVAGDRYKYHMAWKGP